MSNQPSKRTIEKQKNKIVEDLTFGLKNKKKSKVVQKYIKGIEQKVKGNQKKTAAEKEAEQRKLEKQAQKEQEKLLRDLFKPVEDKKQQIIEEDAEEKTEDQIMDEKERLAAKEINYETMTLEEIIEIQRARIKNGTPVTLESFTAWKERKRLRLEEEQKKKLKNALAEYKKSGHGITGKDLFAYDPNLFVDDIEAAEQNELVVDETIDIDEDLFTEDITEDGSVAAEASTSADGSRPATAASTSSAATAEKSTGLPSVYEVNEWNLKKLPKDYVNDCLTSLTILDQAKYEVVSTANNEFRMRCTLPPAVMNHITDKATKDKFKKEGKKQPEFEPIFSYKSKKEAEQSAALAALDWMLFATKAKANIQPK